MTTITRAGTADALLLAEIATTSFIESHGHSAHAEDIDSYIAEKFSIETLIRELNDPDNIIHIIYADGKPAGYSKIILNQPHPEIAHLNVTKLERLYVLKAFYGQPAGKSLFEFSMTWAKEHDQAGMWLYTWMENQRAISFYQKQGFDIIGSFDFPISPSHTNPNHLMYLKF